MTRSPPTPDRGSIRMLFLFDIDGTLVDTGGAGLRALEEASELVFGHKGPPLDLAGSTDLGVLAHIASHFGQTACDDLTARFFAVYHERLEWTLRHGGFPGKILPSVEIVLETLHSIPGATLGLLTGNTAEGAAAKMRHFGLDRFFAFGAHGCDHADRNLLGPIALKRAAIHAGRGFVPEEAIVIGDTPKDIDCARAVGARCLAVATGRYSRVELTAFEPDLAVDQLDEALDWLTLASTR